MQEFNSAKVGCSDTLSGRDLCRFAPESLTSCRQLPWVLGFHLCCHRMPLCVQEAILRAVPNANVQGNRKDSGPLEVAVRKGDTTLWQGDQTQAPPPTPGDS